MKDDSSLFDTAPEILDRLFSHILEEPEGEQAPGMRAALESILEQPGGQLGRYKLLRVLGEGGMGIVYLAEQDRPIRRQVALKVIKPGMDSKRVVARFEAERQALALLDHPNIAQVYDAGTTASGRPYFAMEYVKGSPITEYCDGHRLTVEERLRLFQQLCHAVQHAHQKGIVHRDIKPSNILVAVQDDRATPKIIDFGVAKALAQPLTEKTLVTEQGQLFGTPEYMSPEQADMANEDIDTRSDIYSLGVLLYVLLAGVLPFEPEKLRTGGVDQIRKTIRQTNPKAPSTRLTYLGEEAKKLAERRGTEVAALARRLRDELEWIPLKAMRKERQERYRSAADMADDIDNFLQGAPLMAGPLSTLYLVRKFVKRNRVTVAVTFLALISLLGGLAAATFGFARARSEARRADREAALAEARLQEVLRLSDAKLLAEFEAQADTLWPCVPEKAEAMEAWLAQARDLAGRLPQHEQALQRLRAGGSLADPTLDRLGTERARDQTWTFAGADERWLHDVLSELVTGLRRFQDPKLGVLPDVEERLEFAQTVYQKTIEDHRDAWDRARASIRSTTTCPWYAGLELTYQLGLVPIGQDPKSQLWEFAHLQTGQIPERDAEGNLVLSEETGLVLVLIPGGEFTMGALLPTEQRPEGTPNVDPQTSGSEYTIHNVALSAFFMSKYEMTQGQWLRVTDTNPSFFFAGQLLGDKQINLMHPVEQVSWDDSQRVLRRLGLVLPTEAQWEYAARGGTTSVWWTGNDKQSIAGAGNIADRSCAKDMTVSGWKYETWLEDGYVAHAPVGTYAANPFGLHDVIGNVWEFCRDWYGPYQDPVSAGDGERQVQDVRRRIFRGGSWRHPAAEARSANRDADLPDNRYYYQGLRPARHIDAMK